MKKSIIVLLIAFITLFSAQEVEYIGRMEGHLGLDKTITRIENSDGHIRFNYKLYLRSNAIVNKYNSKEKLSKDEITFANKEIDSVITLLNQYNHGAVPTSTIEPFKATKGALITYCTLAKESFSIAKRRKNRAINADLVLKMTTEQDNFINHIIDVKEKSNARYIESTFLARMYLLPPSERKITKRGILDMYRPEQIGMDDKIAELFKTSFTDKKRSNFAYSLVVATYEGLLKDIYTRHFDKKPCPTGEINVYLTLNKAGAVTDCEVTKSEIKDSLFLEDLSQIIEEKWNFGYGDSTKVHLILRVHSGMNRNATSSGKQELLPALMGKGGLSAELKGLPSLGSMKKVGRSRSEIMKVVRNNMHTLKEIYDTHIKSTPDLEGKLVVKMFIGTDGLLSNCELISSTSKDSTFDSEIIAAIKKWEFGNGGETSITFPFLFQL